MGYKEAILSILNDPETDEILKKATSEDENGYLEEYDRIIKAVPEILKSKAGIQILPLIVYGWMPTILKKSIWDNSIVELLTCKNVVKDKVKDNDKDKNEFKTFDDEEMQTLLDFVNGSYVGVSKLLHFTDPEHWAIWDSNVYAAVAYVAEGKHEEKLSYYCKDNYNRVDNKGNFNDYQNAIREVLISLLKETGHPIYKVLKDAEHPIREIEKRLFYYGRHLKALEKQKSGEQEGKTKNKGKRKEV